MMDEKCFFDCTNDSPVLITCGAGRIETIRKCSIKRGDGVDNKVTGLESIKCHKNCVSTYTSQHHIKRYLSKVENAVDDEETVPPKKSRRSDVKPFTFKEHCIFCGESCVDTAASSRHPDRWRKVFQCRTSDNFKERILLTCDARNDKHGEEVRIRVSAAVSDLHAADAQYHQDCHKLFMAQKNVVAAGNSTKLCNKPDDSALDDLVEDMSLNKSRVWNSIEVQERYFNHGGSLLNTRRKLIDSLLNHFKSDLLVLSGNGVASILVFRNEAPHLLKLVDDKDADDIDVTPIAKTIKKECLERSTDRESYHTRLSQEAASNACSELLLELLAQLSPKLDHTNPAFLIGNIITSLVTNRPTTLQITLGTVLREKSLIEQCYDFGITCSYDEILRFKKSVAHAASAEKELQGLMNSGVGLVQAVADNFDANIASPNGLKSTHSLALLLTQVQKHTGDNQPPQNPTIRRLRKEETKQDPTLPVEIQHYNGPRKPAMPESCSLRHILPLRVLAAQVVAVNRANVSNYSFLCQITQEESCPEYNGFNTTAARTQGHAIQPSTRAIYTPLIDMKPSDPDTIMTAMIESQRMTKSTGQSVTLFTADQQLYRVTVDVLWAYPERFQNFIPRLGGMHMLMSFIGAVGTLMDNSGLEELMNSAFGGVPKMLSGKKFPQNLRALRMVVEELLREVLPASESFSELMSDLMDRASRSRTARMWIMNLVKPVLIMMQFVRAEREGDWPLHLAAVAAMIPYFFASGHINYARYGLYYLRSMEALPDETLREFMKGNHVMRHIPGLWNGIWSDMFIESTFMRYGHEAGGLIGLTLQPSAVTTWALSLHTCSQLRADRTSMKDGHGDKAMTKHKEETASRIRSDAMDREKLRSTLSTFIDPLDPASHPANIVNIATGLVGATGVNVDSSLEIGQQQMKEFESGWPNNFHAALKKTVTTMASTKKSVKIDGAPVYDTELIYTRVMGLQQSRDLNIQDILRYELSASPPALFDEDGDMRSQGKAQLANKLKMKVSNRLNNPPDVIIIDGCALLWTVHWPVTGNVEDYIKNVMGRVNQHLQRCSVHLIFDRYLPTSIKSHTRSNRAGKNATRKHILTLHTPLPPQKVVLNVTHNKTQLINLITQYAVDHLIDTHSNELVITSEHPVPIEIINGNTSLRNDLQTTHEEADVMIVNQLLHLVARGASTVCVVCDDTDVFALLLHFYCSQNLSCALTMESPDAGRTVIDIQATAQEYMGILEYLPGAHALSGCDTTSFIFDIGKATALKVLEAGTPLSMLGTEDANLEDIVSEATNFISKCYGSKYDGAMSDVRFAVWSSKMASSTISSAPKLKTLPPTSDAFVEHVFRAHYQTMIWKSSPSRDPPAADPVRYGWSRKDSVLTPVMLPDDVSPAPIEVLQMIKCGCASDRPCSTGRCSCVVAQMSCSMFCNCHASPECNNGHTRTVSVNDIGDA